MSISFRTSVNQRPLCPILHLNQHVCRSTLLVFPSFVESWKQDVTDSAADSSSQDQLISSCHDRTFHLQSHQTVYTSSYLPLYQVEVSLVLNISGQDQLQFSPTVQSIPELFKINSLACSFLPCQRLSQITDMVFNTSLLHLAGDQNLVFLL